MKRFALIGLGLLLLSTPAHSDNLFGESRFAALASDQSASRVGDVITIVVYQSAEARNAAQNTSRTRRSFEGSIQGGELDESGSLSLDGAYSGQGEVRRSESFVTEISVVVENVLANGDLQVAGQQSMNINGETTLVRVRGRVRPGDIQNGNQVLSTRLADAEISYDGHGFVSRNARPNLIHRFFGLLGLGG
ncbi:MAG: flagellar basal body L-ring protein FlgH [Phycisphaerales bacterium]|nr:flagellar basal body L-ring protein FlgH [Hyphomonadaceae bacterium]